MQLKFFKILLLVILVSSMLFEINCADDEQGKKNRKRKRKNGNGRRRKHRRRKKQKLFSTTEVTEKFENLTTVQLTFPETAVLAIETTLSSNVQSSFSPAVALPNRTPSVSPGIETKTAPFQESKDAENSFSGANTSMSFQKAATAVSSDPPKESKLSGAFAIIDLLFTDIDYDKNDADGRGNWSVATRASSSPQTEYTRKQRNDHNVTEVPGHFRKVTLAVEAQGTTEISRDDEELQLVISSLSSNKKLLAEASHNKSLISTKGEKSAVQNNTENSIQPHSRHKICQTMKLKNLLLKLQSKGFPVQELPLCVADDATWEILNATNRILVEHGLPPLFPCEFGLFGSDCVCDVDAIKKDFRNKLALEIVPLSKAQLLYQTSLTVSDAVRLINSTLIDLNLSPLPWCIVDESRVTANAEQDGIRSHKKSKAEASYSDTEMIDENSCDPEHIRQRYLGYIGKGVITLDPRLINQNLSDLVKVEIINENYAQKGLPAISSDCLSKGESRTSEPSCSLDFDETNSTQLLQFAKKLASEGHISQESVDKRFNNQMTDQDLIQIVFDAAVRSGRISGNCTRPPRVGEVYNPNSEFNQLLALIHGGFLPSDTLQRFARGEITRQWIRANLSRNRAYILSQLPIALRTLIEKKEMPPKIEAAIFSGMYNKSYLLQMIIADDVLVKKLLPARILNMLQERPVPQKLKVIMFSGKNATEIKAQIENDTELLQEIMNPSTYFFYTLFQDETNQNINAALSIVVIIVLVFVMTSLGCTMTITEIAQHARRPKGVIIALFSQFVVMPAAAFGLTQLFDLDLYSAISVLICGCCPGGNLSNILAYALNGDMNLSILMTTCSSILGLGLMPLSIYLYSQLIIPLDSGAVVPFDKIIINIAATILPVGIGIVIRHYKPQWTTFVMRFGAVMLMLGTIAVAVLSGVMLGDAFFLYFPPPVLVCCALLPAVGYFFGYGFAFVAREKPQSRRTICVETGCQNVQLCSTVLKLAFDPVIVGVLFLMPLVYMAFQTAEAFLMVFFFRFYNRCRNQKKVDENSFDIEEKKGLDFTDSEKGEDSTEKETFEEEKKHLEENKTTNQDTKELLSKDTESGVVESWPLEGSPTPAYLDSFQTAGSEKFV